MGIRLYLDSRIKCFDGEYSVKLSLTCAGKWMYTPTGTSVEPRCWERHMFVNFLRFKAGRDR